MIEFFRYFFHQKENIELILIITLCISFLGCIIPILLWWKNFKTELENASKIIREDPSSHRMELFRKVNKIIYRQIFTNIIGETWTKRLVRIICFNWIYLTSLCVVFPAYNGWAVKDSFLMFITIQLWVWSNVLADFVSLSYTRNIILKYSTAKHLSTDIVLNFTKDISVAIVCFFFTVVAGNICFILQTQQDISILKTQYENIFSFNSLFIKYPIIVNGTEIFEFNGIALSLLTSYFPSIISILSVLFLLFVILNKVTEQSVKRTFTVSVCGAFIASLSLFIAAATIYHKVLS
ncbi:MAG: hypothetical protein ACI8ZB_003997 [Desulforhopalus sp.]|jgi:hypothetical protein